MRFLVTGAHGTLGTDVVSVLQSRGLECLATDHQELDITSWPALELAAGGKFGKFDWLINCAAYTAVDKAEEEFALASKLNGAAPGLLALACEAMGARLLQVSTDFVFDGLASLPYTELAPTHPTGRYGKSKEMGEKAALQVKSTVVARTAWLYGPHGKSFPKTMIGAWAAGKSLKVVSDQMGSPTCTIDLALMLVEMCEKNVDPGIYHTAGPEAMTWFDFAGLAIQAYCDDRGLNRAIEISPCKTEDWPTPAKRPAYSVLDSSKVLALGVTPMRSVRSSMADFVSKIEL